ncbi:hypothetical protein GCM10010052_14930 [Paenarthrobacter histidinolovorans]|nr:hypothetical protein GCM10010052_14930 [Paenarthrobacter histidinolovorans]
MVSEAQLGVKPSAKLKATRTQDNRILADSAERKRTNLRRTLAERALLRALGRTAKWGTVPLVVTL